LTVAVYGFCKPALGGLMYLVPIYGFVASSLMLGKAISKQSDSRKRRAICMSLAYTALSLGCAFAVVVIGISIELLPAYIAHTEREKRAERAKADREMQAKLEPILEEVLDKIDPERKQREKVACALRDIRMSEDKTAFTCSALMTNKNEQLIHLGRSAVRCQIDDLELPMEITAWPGTGAVLMIAPSETKAIALSCSNPNDVFAHGEEFAFKLLVECFVQNDADWSMKHIEFGDYEFKLLDDDVTPALVSTWGKKGKPRVSHSTPTDHP